jgi:hypothetical protein
MQTFSFLPNYRARGVAQTEEKGEGLLIKQACDSYELCCTSISSGTITR